MSYIPRPMYKRDNRYATTNTSTTRKHKINYGDIPREFVVKEVLRGISEETRFVVTRSS